MLIPFLVFFALFVTCVVILARAVKSNGGQNRKREDNDPSALWMLNAMPPQFPTVTTQDGHPCNHQHHHGHHHQVDHPPQPSHDAGGHHGGHDASPSGVDSSGGSAGGFDGGGHSHH